ncbi:rhombosortase [Aliiglaciecola sp. LCG003]|uniref:rhombosortase n=1 Tax=Aliiglaciecola sp. LCG003 TaxID=3053655 RepID=UPI002573DFE8|nr:rhombosortase [Aliiglaciecola sp. LCG003]WJG07774.1 rhombosortase [Aliiglaciecola sp. LCG003]
MIALLVLLAWGLEPLSSQYFAYQIDPLGQVQLYQFITANLIHTNTTHTVLNLAALGLLWAIHGLYYRFWQFLAMCLFFSVCVTLGIWMFSTDLLWYAGLSGTLHGIFVYGAYQDVINKVKLGWLIMSGLWLKIIYEQVFGQDQMVAQLIEANVAVDAHLYGAIAAVIWLLGCFFVRQKNAQKNI